MTISSAIDPRPAIGFDLGQSYGTAVAHFTNGTVVRLAKVEGSQHYQAFFPKRAATATGRLLTQYTGIGGLDGVAILAEMLRALRTASEAVLGSPLPATVVITAPYVIAWEYEETLDTNYVARVRKLAGLKHVRMGNMDSFYLGEANTILAANGHMLCPDLFCNGPEWTNEDFQTYDAVYLVSFTNRSLYTSFQISTCFFWPPRGPRLAMINPKLGFSQLEQAADQDVFWDELQEYLEARIRDYVEIPDTYRESFLIVLSGEAADNPRFQEAIRRIISHMQKDPIYRTTRDGRAPKIKLLVSEDQTYAAAKGVAFGQRIRMDSTYCLDWHQREERRKMMLGRDTKSRDEL